MMVIMSTFTYIFIFNIDSNHNQAHIKATKCFSGKLASLNVVSPLTTLSMLIVRLELPLLNCLIFVCLSL